MSQIPESADDQLSPDGCGERLLQVVLYGIMALSSGLLAFILHAVLMATPPIITSKAEWWGWFIFADVLICVCIWGSTKVLFALWKKQNRGRLKQISEKAEKRSLAFILIPAYLMIGCGIIFNIVMGIKWLIQSIRVILGI